MKSPFRLATSLASFGAIMALASLASGCRRKDDAQTSLDAAAGGRPARSQARSTTNPPGNLDRNKDRALPWIENDWDEAFRLARRDKKKVFVDVWATWCHSCLSMKEFVFSDPKVLAARDKVIWLALDTDRVENEKRIKTLSAPALPTFYLFDADKPDPIRRFVGSMSVEESLVFVGEGTSVPSAYDKVFALYDAKKYPECFELGSTATPLNPADELNTRALATTCALEQSPRNTKALQDIAMELSKRVNDLRSKVIADDRSGAYEVLVEALDALAKEAPKEKAQDAKASLDAKRQRDEEARHWVAFLDLEASATTTARARAVFDPHRYLAYSAAGTPEKAIPMLIESAKDFPDDFNPHARLAKVYLEVKQFDRAEEAIDAALTKGYGPRKLRLYATAISIARGQKNAALEGTRIREALAFSETFSLSAGYKKLVAEFQTRAKELAKK